MNSRHPVGLMLVVPALALGACGGGSSDSSKIKDLINHVAKDSPYACDHVTAKLLAQLGNSVAACKKGLQGSKAASVKGDITVKVSGSKAIADFTTSKGAPRHLSLVKDGSDWKIDAIS